MPPKASWECKGVGLLACRRGADRTAAAPIRFLQTRKQEGHLTTRSSNLLSPAHRSPASSSTRIYGTGGRRQSRDRFRRNSR